MGQAGRYQNMIKFDEFQFVFFACDKVCLNVENIFILNNLTLTSFFESISLGGNIV